MSRTAAFAREDQREALFHEIVEALDGMPAHIQEAFIRTHYRGGAVEDVARESNISLSAARERLRMANRILYSRLGRKPL